MKAISYRTFFVLTLFSLSFTASYATAESEGVESLSSDVREMLKKEMVAVESAMKDIVSANAAGDTAKVALIARQIKDSFILSQSLTPHQKHQLHSKLPKDFVEQDENFHYLAGMLEHVAEKNKPELIGFYYSKLFEACASCHKVHAKHRFTKFSTPVKASKHHH